MMGSNAICNVYRFVKSGGKDSYESNAVISSEPAYIEPLNPQMALTFNEQNAYRMYRIFFDGKLDVRITDKITDNDGREFVVEGTEPFINNTDTGDITRLTCALRYP